MFIKYYQVKNKNKIIQGVSLIKILIAIAIISILASIGAGAYYSFKKNTDIKLVSQKVANLIYNTQDKAKAMTNDDAWGINISSSHAIIFKGTNFSSRNQSHDEDIPLQGIISVSGITQIIFYKLTGLPYASSIGSLILGNGDATADIQINAEGIISY